MTVSLRDFHASYGRVHYSLDREKRTVIDAGPHDALHVVAGPGTGKTTALVARILKLCMVDGLAPSSIVATTFTKKAASELRSRIIEVGFPLAADLTATASTDAARTWIESVDVNQIWTGTTDSLCQELLTRHRLPGEEVPVVADEFVTSMLMLAQGVFGNRRDNSTSLKELLQTATGSSWMIVPIMRQVLSTISDRRAHDEIDFARFLRSGGQGERKGRQRLDEALSDYDAEMAKRSFVDYAGVETEALRRLQAGKLDEYCSSVSAILVDEYQDTNLLQEDFYLTLSSRTGGAITVVGDDDQSLYRFRGATVELFTDFPNRASTRLATSATTCYLTTNHRSTKNIVSFVNSFVQNDMRYQEARSVGKPLLKSRSGVATGVPILGMFRPDVPALAEGLAKFLEDVFQRSGRRLPDGEVLRKGRGGGLADAALLSYSPKEDNRERLIPQLREQMQNRGMALFNPRGHNTTDVRVVQLIVGLSLQALDPSESITSTLYQRPETRTRLDEWRQHASAAVSADRGLRRLIGNWQKRESTGSWAARTPYLELLYGIAQLLPGCLDDPEEALYVELFARQVNAAEQVGGYRGQVLLNRNGQSRRGGPLGDGSIKELFKNVILPVANGEVGLNEDLIDAFPVNRLPVLSIHQSKGLEFPLVIVDVGSRFRINHAKQARMRFPQVGDEAHQLEDYFRRYSPLGRPVRSQVDRAFDDLIRQYFVAFSRARNALLLVGLTSALPGGPIPNVALGWDRDGKDNWAAALPFVEV